MKRFFKSCSGSNAKHNGIVTVIHEIDKENRDLRDFRAYECEDAAGQTFIAFQNELLNYSQTQKELENANLFSLAETLLGSKLIVDPDYEKENQEDPDAYRTEDLAFSFTPLLDCPVMSPARIGKDPKPLPGRFHYAVEITKCFPSNSRMEPDDYDQVEIARSTSIQKAIGEAAHYLLDQKIEGVGEELYWQTQSELEKMFPDPLKD